MVWSFLLLGIALLVVGVLLAVVPMLHADRAHGHGDGAEEAWDVLSQPLDAKHELIKLPKDEPAWARLMGNKFLQGSFVGAGASLVVVGVVLSYALLSPSGLNKAEAATTAPKVADQAATQPPTTTPGAATTTVPANQPAPKPTTPVTFVVDPGTASDTIAYNLKLQGLIDSQHDFLDRLTARGAETSLQAGTFTIPQGATMDQIIDILTLKA